MSGAQGAKGKVWGEGSHASGGGAVAPKEAGAGESGNGRRKSFGISLGIGSSGGASDDHFRRQFL
jgi:hypothetical protein